MNINDFFAGTVFDAYEYFGAHRKNSKIVFRTYAPGAEKVNIFGSFNGWTEEPMKRDSVGIYEFESDKAHFGDIYKYVIYTKNGERVEHCDPYGFGMELRPAFATYIVNLEEYNFSDEKWMHSRNKNYNSPMNIYEVHLGSWKTNPDNPNGWYNYSEIADMLIDYAKQNHYTHLEFLPLSEHPADCSWGYQNTGFFSPTSRYGTAAQLMELVDKCHQNGIGVIMDFVPVHFAVDGYGLAKYDGTFLYEYPPSDVGISEWGTCNFNHSRNETRCFVQSAANFWLEKFHFDGLRMDAISRAIYWGGDPARGVNDHTVSFLKNMNTGLRKRHPSAMLIAEDSTSFPKITAPVEYDGLGFDYKWDLGWMNDTLDFFRTAPWERHNHYYKLTFSMAYFYSELFILPFSHDENVHGKATIIQKMYGDYDEKFMQCRALYMYMYAHPGKKLNFMGNEIGQFREWAEDREQDWDILHYPLHDAFRKYICKLNELYTENPALYNGEYDMSNFRWLVADDCEQCVYVFERSFGTHSVISVFNFSGTEQKVSFAAGKYSKLKELLNSRWEEYGGDVPRKKSPYIAAKKKGQSEIFTLTVTPQTGIMFKAY
ncbi:1,4-alpha-glucan branching protein GlgB [Porcipelethomonas sp.]|uniref:1,4-alpha-glucan branching protein GlgB n=1 Tax=Porcipelethomonas sp. TaxID=2981675 RepID=UPI003EF759F9